MLVSVAIPTYNAAEFLTEAIESVLSQTHQPLEIIVIDDGSSDNTREVCMSFGSAIKYFYQENDGSSGAGAQIRAWLDTSGEYIAFLDHDDRWLPDKIEKQLQEFSKHPEAGAAFTMARWIDSNGVVIGASDSALPSGDVFHHLLNGCLYTFSSCLVRRSALARSGLHDIDSICGDWEQLLRIARYYPVAVVNECLTEYRIHETNYSRDKGQIALGMARVLSRFSDRLHENCEACISAMRDGWANVARSNWNCARSEFFEAGLWAAIPFLRRAFRASPKEFLRSYYFMAVIKNAPRLLF